MVYCFFSENLDCPRVQKKQTLFQESGKSRVLFWRQELEKTDDMSIVSMGMNLVTWYCRTLGYETENFIGLFQTWVQ